MERRLPSEEMTYFFDMRRVQWEIEPESSQMNLSLFDLVQDEPVVHVSESRQFTDIQIVSETKDISFRRFNFFGKKIKR